MSDTTGTTDARPVELDRRELERYARSIRVNSLAAIYHAGSGHPGGALSAADLIAYVYYRAVRRGALSGEDRDRFVLSKGHSCPALYAAAAEAGLIDHAELASLRKLGSRLQGHPHVRSLPMVETSTGSLGQGFSVAIGIALGLRYRGSSARVTVMVGDGELQEGEVWEGAMFASHHALDGLTGIVDYNKMQSDDLNANIIQLEPLAAKWEAFGWHVFEIDGHDFAQIDAAISGASAVVGRPSVIIAHTIKGKGVSFMEGSPLWHGSLKLSDDQLRDSLRELGVPNEEVGTYLSGTAPLKEQADA